MLNDLITTSLHYINTITAGNVAMAGALTLSISAGLMYLLKQSPMAIFNFLRNQCLTSISFNNTTYEMRNMYNSLSNFLAKNSSSTFTRTLAAYGTYNRNTNSHVIDIGIGYGRHVSFYRGRPIFILKNKLDSTGSDAIKEEITLFKFGRSHELFYDLIKDHNVTSSDGRVHLRKFEQDCWDTEGYLDCGGLDSLALSESVKKFLRDEMDFFLNNEGTYKSLGLPWKITMLLHGIPGSGKTSIIRALAKDYNLSLCVLPIMTVGDVTIFKALQKCPRKSILVIEDFDSCAATKARKNVAKRDVMSAAATAQALNSNVTDGSVTELIDGLSLTSFLNALDGLASLDGIVVMLTTNCISDIDPAITRPGRVDRIVELPIITSDVVKDHFVKLYPELAEMDINYPSLSACQINQIKSISKADTTAVAKYLNGELSLDPKLE